EPLALEPTARRLVDLGYERVSQVDEPGQFALRGGILDVFPATAPVPVRIELFGDEIESMREFDPASQRSTRGIESVSIAPAAELQAPPASEHSTFTLLEHMPSGTLVVLDEPNHMRSRWLEFRENLQRQAELARESEKVLPEHVTGIAPSSFLELET